MSEDKKFKIPEWHEPGLEPPEQLKQRGWQFLEKPPHEYFNWQWHNTYKSLEHHQEKVDDHEQRITMVEEQLSTAADAKLPLAHGVQAVNVLSDSGLQMEFKGRTLVNLLGRDGNCEIIPPNQFLQRVTTSLDSTSYVYGNAALKIVSTSTSGQHYFRFSNTISTRPKVKPNTHYLLGAHLKCNSLAKALLGSWSIDAQEQHTNLGTTNLVDNQDFKFLYLKVRTPSNADSILWHVALFDKNGSGEYSGSGETVWIDGCFLYEISEAEYNALDSMSPEEVDRMYPYVDSVQHVQNPYVISSGKNLIPNISDYTNLINTSNSTFTFNQNEVTINKVIAQAGNAAVLEYKVRCVPNQKYTFNVLVDVLAISEGGVGAFYNIFVYDKNDKRIAQLHEPPYADVVGQMNLGKSFTTPPDADYLVLSIGVSQTTVGKTTFSKLQLELGDKAAEFTPHSPTYLFGKDVILADGERAYQLPNGEWHKWQEWEQVEIGSIPSNMVLGANKVGYKAVRFVGYKRKLGEMVVNSTPRLCVKFDGKILQNKASFDEVDSIWLDSTNDYLYVTIPNTDSGWGDNYTPTADEIKAYFMGWQMYNRDTGVSPYNGTGVKGWQNLVNIIEKAHAVFPTGVVPTSPVTSGNYTPYHLHYKLAEPREVPVTFEGSLHVHDGLNQIEVGTGVIVRELANPVYNGDNSYHINRNQVLGTDYTKGNLKNRVERSFLWYKNGSETKMFMISDSLAYGKERYFMWKEDYDPEASYSVTYLVLDRYQFTTNLLEVTGTYQTTIGSQVQENTKQIVNHERRITVVENEYARKQQGQWINAILQNGWVSEGTRTASYSKNDLGIVQISGLIREGIKTNGTLVFTLPKGYRPARGMRFVTYSYKGSEGIHNGGVISVNTNGTVVVHFCAGDNLGLDVMFFGEQ